MLLPPIMPMSAAQHPGWVNEETAPQPKYFDIVSIAFVSVLLIATITGGPKVTQLGPFHCNAFNIGPLSFAGLNLPPVTVGAGILFYPFIYLFNDILTEVYGYGRSRRAVWAGFTALLFASLAAMVIIKMPPSPEWHNQQALETLIGQTPRIVFASLVAFACGEFVNSYIMAKLKVFTRGHLLPFRTITSTLIGVAVDASLFYPIAFWGVWAWPLMKTVMLQEYILKVLGEIILTPVTAQVCHSLKRMEGVDFYDTNTNFSPFSLETD
jgi:queuosine precursor transporter